VDTAHRDPHHVTPPPSLQHPARSASKVALTLSTMLDTDPGVVDRDELAELVTSVAHLRSWLDAYEMRCARRTHELANAGLSEPAAAMLSRSGQHSNKDAGRIADRHAACDQLEHFEDALSNGLISAGHLDGAAAAMRHLDDATRADFTAAAPELLDTATSTNVDDFNRQCRDLARHLVARRAASGSDADELDRQRANVSVKRWVDKITGMHHTVLELDPLRDAAVWSGIDAQLAALRNVDGNARTPWNQLQANAVVAAITNGCTNRRPAPTARAAEAPGSDHADDVAHGLRVPEITLIVDYATIESGLHDHSVCETEDGVPVPVSTVRRLCCDADIIPVILGTNGVPLDMGRSIRTANRSQRRALRAMHRTCAHPDCTAPFSQCKAHHIRWWWKHRGRTDIDNLLPLCERHHHLVHEGGWGLTMTSDRTATWTRPNGSIHHTGTTIDRQPDARPLAPTANAVHGGSTPKSSYNGRGSR
jgi:hypothetical protein